MCYLFADASTNNMFVPVYKASIDKTIGFLVEWLAVVQLLAQVKKGQVV